jgi:hypothetical protein
MTMPERLTPKTCTHTVAQEYAWACNFVGDRRCVKDGSASGSWARLIEVLARAASPIMQEANREMREMDLAVCREMAEERSEYRLRTIRDTFVVKHISQMGVSKETAWEMWEPAFIALKAHHKTWIEDELLERLILEAEAWRVSLTNDTCSGLPAKRKDDGGDDEGEGGDLRSKS